MTTGVFFGHGDLGAACLELLANTVDVPLVVVRKGVAPGQAVYDKAAELGLRTVDSITDAASETQKVQPHYLVSVLYNRILPTHLLDSCTIGGLNLHLGLLPKQRGCFPSKWAIINDHGGVTFHWMDAGIDTGRIIRREVVRVAENETDRTMHAALCAAGLAMFRHYVPFIARQMVPQGEEQNEALARYYDKTVPHEGAVNWVWTVQEIDRFIRAMIFPPHPPAHCYISNQKATILEHRLGWAPTSELPGTVLHQNGAWTQIACSDGSIHVRTQ